METSRISDQLSRSVHGPAWHGPSMEEVLKDVTAGNATVRVCGATHSIAELLLHAAAWARASRLAMDGVAIPEDLPDDWTTLDSLDEAEWTHLRKDALAELDQITAKTAEFPEARLTERVPGRNFDFYFNLHGVAQHTIYHAGQIAILKRQINASA